MQFAGDALALALLGVQSQTQALPITAQRTAMQPPDHEQQHRGQRHVEQRAQVERLGHVQGQ